MKLNIAALRTSGKAADPPVELCVRHTLLGTNVVLCLRHRAGPVQAFRCPRQVEPMQMKKIEMIENGRPIEAV